jgi:hypothetical protein
MSFWNYVFDNDYLQRQDIESLKARLANSAHRTRLTRANEMHRIQELESEMHGMVLYCQTAVALMVEKGLITREEFINRMNEISAAAADGRNPPSP